MVSYLIRGGTEVEGELIEFRRHVKLCCKMSSHIDESDTTTTISKL